MRVAFIVLLVALFLSIGVASTSVVETANIPPIDANCRTSRRLRTNDEERAMQIPGNWKLAKWLNSKGQTVSMRDKLKAMSWIRKKDSVDTVFKRLKLDSGIDDVLSNPKIMAWETYMDLFNKKYPDKRETMADLLTNTYGDLALARTLQTTRNVKTKKLAARLRIEQLNAWKDAKKSADDIFNLLKLDKAGNQLFQSPQLNTWYSYVTMINRKDPEAEMVNVLAGWYGYDGLAKIFLFAEPRVGRMRQIEVNLETTMGRQWLSQKKSPEDVFKLLKLDDEVDKVLTNPTFKAWLGYLSFFNLKKPDEATTRIQTLVNVYGYKEVTRMLESAEKVSSTQNIAKNLLTELKEQKLMATRNK